MDQQQPITYTQAVTELEELVEKMQQPDCSIDHLSQYTKRSKELLEFCRSKLTATDQELQQILASLQDGGDR